MKNRKKVQIDIERDGYLDMYSYSRDITVRISYELLLEWRIID